MCSMLNIGLFCELCRALLSHDRPSEATTFRRMLQAIDIEPLRLILDIPFDEKPSAHRPKRREAERAAA